MSRAISKALWWSGDLSEVYPIIRPMSEIGSSPFKTLQKMSGIQVLQILHKLDTVLNDKTAVRLCSFESVSDEFEYIFDNTVDFLNCANLDAFCVAISVPCFPLLWSR